VLFGAFGRLPRGFEKESSEIFNLIVYWLF